MSIWQQILNWDRELFHLINGRWANPVFDKAVAICPQCDHLDTLLCFHVYIYRHQFQTQRAFLDLVRNTHRRKCRHS